MAAGATEVAAVATADMGDLAMTAAVADVALSVVAAAVVMAAKEMSLTAPPADSVAAEALKRCSHFFCVLEIF